MDFMEGCNTTLCSLSKSQLISFLRIINKKDLVFRDELDLSPTISYGNEIEVNGIELEHAKVMVDYFNKERDLDDSRLYTAHEELTASCEVVTPILTNDRDMWKNYYDMYQMLRESGATISDNTASHIHIGTHPINTPHLLSLFLKMLVVFEPIIFKFGYGTTSVPREFIRCRFSNSNYSMMMSPKRVSKFVQTMDKYNPKHVDAMAESFASFLADDLEFRPVFNFKSFDFNKLQYGLPVSEPKTIDHMEVRCFNGTLSPEIGQNNINLIAHIVEAVATGRIDEKYLEEEYKRYKKKTYDFDVWRAVILDDRECLRYNRLLDGFNRVKMDKALKLADMIFSNDLDKAYFLKQYLKLFDVKDEEVVRLVK